MTPKNYFCQSCGVKTVQKTYMFPRIKLDVLVCQNCRRASEKSIAKQLVPQDSDGIKAAKKAEWLKSLTQEHLDSYNIKLKVLVWGENLSQDTDGARKRKEIIEHLEKSHNFESFVSENGSPENIPVSLAENIHQKLVNLIVCVASNFGPIGELHEHAISIGPRGLWWVNKKGEDGYSGEGIIKNIEAGGGFVEYFTEDQLKTCALRVATLKWLRDKYNFELSNKIQIQDFIRASSKKYSLLEE
jgi:hypothetical protein